MTAKTSPKPNQGNSSTTGSVNYCYDSDNRVTSKAYNTSACPPASPQVTYTYDQGTNGIGRRTGMTDVPGSSSWTYDPMGRIAIETRTTSNATKNMAYGYNKGGSLNGITYPSGRTITYTVGGAGRSISAIDQNGTPSNTSDDINYLTATTYAPQGAIQSYINGVSGGFAGISTSNTYNSRLQPVFLSAASPTATILSLGYDFHVATGDNGNVFQIVNNRDANRTQNFTYDSLNRIQQAYSSGPMWGETFGSEAAPGAAPVTPGIDAWGNLWQRSPVTGKTYRELLSVGVLNNNQLSGFGYDAAGNMTSNSPANYQYNQEGQMTKFISTDTDIYIYDGDGRRVKKNTGAVTLYWYDAGGNVLDETLGNGNLTSEYVYFGSKRIARRDANNSVHYYFSDHLGSASVVTDAVGTMSLCPAANSPMNYTTIPTGEEESDFYPYGGEMQLCTRSPQHYKFTGKERDAESGNDYFGARYFASSSGRFMTPDWAARPTAVPYAVFGDPQSLNLYTYVRNDPVSRADADGHQQGYAYSCINGNCVTSTTAQQTDKAQNNKPLTAAQIQKGFYGKYGKSFADAVNKVFGKDASKVPAQTLANAPKLDTTKTRADLSAMGKAEPTEARNRVDVATSLAQNGTIFIPKETVASGNMKAIYGDYAHELGNLLDFQINGYRGPIGTEKNYGDSNPKTNEGDPDTGRNIEVTMFGSQQY